MTSFVPFSVDQLGLPVIEEEPGRFFAVDAGGLRLCVDVEDGPGTEAVESLLLGFRVRSIAEAALQLAMRGLRSSEPSRPGSRRVFIRLPAPDGRLVVLAEDEAHGEGSGVASIPAVVPT